jgi:hypothetical protein
MRSTPAIADALTAKSERCDDLSLRGGRSPIASRRLPRPSFALLLIATALQKRAKMKLLGERFGR